jgi:hypothetical protein
LTRFRSFDQFKKEIHIEYEKGGDGSNSTNKRKHLVRLTYSSCGSEVTSILSTGVSQNDFSLAQKGGFWDRVSLVLKSPYSIWNRKDMRTAYALSRRDGSVFREGDVAFYDLAELMSQNISEHDKLSIPDIDLSEKGYINTFNHITAQAFMTSVFSEKLADFIADAHERHNMPELITGEFSEDQLADIENGPTDNYVDMINNEWGQEIGKLLKERYNISRETVWTPKLVENYLNDIQVYYSWSFQIGFEPVRSTDEVVIRFTNKMNSVLAEVPYVR